MLSKNYQQTNRNEQLREARNFAVVDAAEVLVPVLILTTLSILTIFYYKLEKRK